jgi:hypothetical protein
MPNSITHTPGPWLDILQSDYSGGFLILTDKNPYCFQPMKSADKLLMLAAPDLLDAAELVIAHWERGDLAEAVRGLNAAIAKAKGRCRVSAVKSALLYIDQYGSPVWARTVSELRDRAGGGRVSKMYCDKLDGRTVQTGYVVGKRWFSAYAPVEKPAFVVAKGGAA